MQVFREISGANKKEKKAQREAPVQLVIFSSDFSDVEIEIF